MRLVRAGALGAAAFCLVSRAHAQPAATVPPELVLAPPPACVPDTEQGAIVRLEVVVGEDGAVTEVSVIDGAAPFLEPALASARAHRFRPARVGDAPRAARVRLEVGVAPCAMAPSPPPAVVTPPPPKPPPPPELGMDDVDVRGRRETYTPGERALGRAELRDVPGAFGDPFRAIDVLPGVVPTISGLPFYYIRGAPPSAVGYFVDEVRVPYLFHFALGPGVIQPALVDAISVHPASFPGRFGRFAGAVVEGRTKDAPTELRGEGQIRLFDTGAYVESPLGDGRASVGAGGRFSYTAALVSLLAPNVSIAYRDYNLRASYALDARTRVSVFTFGSFDFASQIENGEEKVAFASEFHRVDLRLDRRGDDGAETRLAVTFGLDRTRLEGERFARDHVLGLRARHRRRLGKAVDLEIGADTTFDLYSGDLPSPYAVSESDYQDALELFAPRTDTASGAWASLAYRPGRGVELTGTARADVFTSAGAVAFGPSPRLTARVPLRRGLALIAAMGVAPQPPVFAVPLPAVGYRGLPGGLSFGYQKSVGGELDLPARFRLAATAFHHSYVNLRDFTQSSDRETIELPTADAQAGQAQAYGLEAMVGRKLSERYTAYASYTLSRSVRGSTRFLPSTLSPFDRTHVFQVGGAVDLGRRWRLSSRLVTYSGWPALSALVTSGNERLSSFLRIDARLEKSWAFRRDGRISLVFEGLNVTGSKETIGQSCDGLRCEPDQIGPLVIPSIGVEGAL